jgi:hypothetical protein
MYKFHRIIDAIHGQGRLRFCYANADLILLQRFQIQLITKGCVWSAGFAYMDVGKEREQERKLCLRWQAELALQRQ